MQGPQQCKLVLSINWLGIWKQQDGFLGSRELPIQGTCIKLQCYFTNYLFLCIVYQIRWAEYMDIRNDFKVPYLQSLLCTQGGVQLQYIEMSYLRHWMSILCILKCIGTLVNWCIVVAMRTAYDSCRRVLSGNFPKRRLDDHPGRNRDAQHARHLWSRARSDRLPPNQLHSSVESLGQQDLHSSSWCRSHGRHSSWCRSHGQHWVDDSSESTAEILSPSSSFCSISNFYDEWLRWHSTERCVRFACLLLTSISVVAETLAWADDTCLARSSVGSNA